MELLADRKPRCSGGGVDVICGSIVRSRILGVASPCTAAPDGRRPCAIRGSELKAGSVVLARRGLPADAPADWSERLANSSASSTVEDSDSSASDAETLTLSESTSSSAYE
jgi:hypothetical protein